MSQENNVIFIVEDDPQINNLFHKILSARGYDCHSLLSVPETIEALENIGAPDLMILDLQLGDARGTEVLDFVKEHQLDHIKMIVVSANAYSSDYLPETYKIDCILLKPVSPRGLAALVKQELSAN